MVVRGVAFTTAGEALLDQIEGQLYMERKPVEMTYEEWMWESFALCVPLLFVGAIGIAVRMIAPHVKDKLTDSPVVVMDEKGQFVIPLLSNHVGGANALAFRLAEITQGQVVLTTATDVNDTFAVDVFARKNGLHIVNREAIKTVSAKLLKKGQITMLVQPEFTIEEEAVPACITLLRNTKETADVVIVSSDCPKDSAEGEQKEENKPLLLRFKPYVLGVGCKKDTPLEKLEQFIGQELNEHQIKEEMVAKMASIDRKQTERGLLYYEAKHRVCFVTYTAEELLQMEGEFRESAFVESVTGVSNVCERAAMCAAGEAATLVVPKVARDGMTLAISKRKERICIWET